MEFKVGKMPAKTAGYFWEKDLLKTYKGNQKRSIRGRLQQQVSHGLLWAAYPQVYL